MEEGTELNKGNEAGNNVNPSGKRLSRSSTRRTIGRTTFKNTNPVFLVITTNTLTKAENLELLTKLELVKKLDEKKILNEDKDNKELHRIKQDSRLEALQRITELNSLDEHNRLEALKLLIPAQHNVNESIGFGKKPLHTAAGLGLVTIMDYLINLGAEINFNGKPLELNKQSAEDKGSLKRLPIHDAAENGQAGAIILLIAVGSKVNEKDGTGFTPLHLATKEGHHQAVIALCNNGASLDITNKIDISDEVGETALHLALSYDQRGIALELLQRGANFALRNNDGKSAYLMAFSKGFTEVLQVMDEQLALQENDKTQQCTLTRFQRAGLDYIDDIGNTLFHHAAMSGDVEAITLYASLEVNPTNKTKKKHRTPPFAKKTNKKGRTALFLAAKHGQKEAMIKLHELSVSHTETDGYEISPLEIANKYDHTECVQQLKEWPEPQTTEDQAEEKSNSTSEDDQPTRPVEPHSGDEDKKQGTSETVADTDDIFLQMMAAVQSSGDTTANQTSITSDEQPQQSSPATTNSKEHTQVLKECHVIFDPVDKLKNSELAEFLKLLSNTNTLDEITEIKTQSGENLLCMIAKHDPDGKLMTILKQFSVAQIEKLFQFKTTNGENCLHIACHYLHLVLFEFCMDKIPHLKLVEMARDRTVDNGFTPYHCLCASTYDDRTIKRKTLVESQNFLSQMIPREEIPNSELPENVCLMMRRMGTVFGEYTDIFKIEDHRGNTGLMLCVYTLHPMLINACLTSIINLETKLFCILLSNQSKSTNPLRYITAMGGAVVLEAMMKPFGDRAQTICLEEQLLQWSQVTTVPYQVDSPIRPQLDATLEFLIRQYYWDHKKAGFTEEFKDSLINEFYGKALLLRSLDDCGGVLINRVLAVKHLSRKPEVLFLLMGHMAPMPAPHSPRGFSAKSTGLDSHKSVLNVADASSPAFSLRRELLHRVFRVHWPDNLLEELSLHIVSTLGTPRYTSLKKSSDEKLLRIINSNLCDSHHRNLRVDYSVLILALFYQVTQVSGQKQAIEAEYVRHFKENTKTMLDKMSSFYESLAQQNPDLADQFLGELFEGNSLLKAAFTELFPEQADCLKGEKTNFIAYTKQLWSDNKAASDDSTCVLL